MPPLTPPPSTREYLAPTDWLCLVALLVVAGLYAYTKEGDWKVVVIALVGMISGRVSKRAGL